MSDWPIVKTRFMSSVTGKIHIKENTNWYNRVEKYLDHANKLKF